MLPPTLVPGEHIRVPLASTPKAPQIPEPAIKLANWMGALSGRHFVVKGVTITKCSPSVDMLACNRSAVELHVAVVDGVEVAEGDGSGG